MEREILFRGKTLAENKWVEGDLGHCPDGRPFILFWNDDKNYTVANVDPATVGQFTGLTDKHGVRIFEGDVVVDAWGENKWQVQFSDARFWGVDVEKIYASVELGELADLMPGNFEGVTIIGNIHDNPDLRED